MSITLFWVVLGLMALLGLGAGLWWWFFKPAEAETPFLLLQQQLDALRGEMRQQSQNHLEFLQKSHQGIDQRLDNASRFFGGMEAKLVKVEETSKRVLEVGKDIATLQQILKAPKLRGNFSEQLLGDLLAQMMPQDNFVLQYTFSNGERVDAIIKTAERLVSVDAKFPLENFQLLLLAQTEEEKRGFRKKFIADVKKHVDDIARKYILPAEGTFEFALMYIPAENVYYEIITKDMASGEEGSLVHYALKKKVIPVSPNTFYAYLQTILLGLRGMQVQKRVQEILKEMGRVRVELASFREDFSMLGKHLTHAVSSFGKSDKRLTRLEDKLETLETLPPTETLPEPTSSEPTSSEVQPEPPLLPS